MSKTPKAWIGVTELDTLRDEAIQYGAKLSKVSIEVEIYMYTASYHGDGRYVFYLNTG